MYTRFRSQLFLFNLILLILFLSPSFLSAQFNLVEDNFAGFSKGDVSIADFNNDGKLDIVITGYEGAIKGFDPITELYLGKGDGIYKLAEAGLFDYLGYSLTSADFNKDGNMDLLVTGTNINYPYEKYKSIPLLYFGDGKGGFKRDTLGMREILGSTSAGDLNGDGNLDIVVAPQVVDSTKNTLVYMGDGKGNFNLKSDTLPGIGRGSTALSDINSDGHLDLLLNGTDKDWNGVTYLFYGDGKGGFEKAETNFENQTRSSYYNSRSSMSVGDVNEDDKKDILITGRDSGNAKTILYINNGGGNFKKSDANLIGVYEGSTSFGDLNADGHLDILITGGRYRKEYEHKTVLYFGDGNGNFNRSKFKFNGVSRSSSAIADVNDDGYNDIFIAGIYFDSGHSAYPETYLYLNNGGYNAIQKSKQVPNKVKLKPNHPNPFNPTTQIQFSLKQAARVNLSVYDVLGRHIRTLIQEKRHAGQHTITFDASGLSSGVYIYQLKTDHYTKSRKMLFVK